MKEVIGRPESIPIVNGPRPSGLLCWGSYEHQTSKLVVSKWLIPRVPLWCSRLRIWCHCNGLGHCCGAGSVSGLGTFTCQGCGPRKKSRSFPSIFQRVLLLPTEIMAVEGSSRVYVLVSSREKRARMCDL